MRPIWILVFGALALLLADAFARAREVGFLRNLALIVVALAFASAWSQVGDTEHDLGHFALSRALLVDHLAIACDLLALLTLAGVIALAGERSNASVNRTFGEREPLLLLAGAGALVCIHAGDLMIVWLGVELLGIATLLTSLADPDSVGNRHRRSALAIHMVPAAVVSCLMLLGIALIYAALGTTSLDGFARASTKVFAQWGGTQRWVLIVERYGEDLARQDPGALIQARSEIVHGLAPAALFLPGVLLLLGGLLTKLGLLPFARRREMVEQAPLHASALWSTLGAVALTAALLRIYAGALNSPRLANEPYGWTGALPTIALLTGCWAALASLYQRRLSRVVALLSLVQVSLVLLGIVAATSFHGHIGIGARYLAPEYEMLWSRVTGDETCAAVLILLGTSVIATLGCFAALAASPSAVGPQLRMQHWSGMAKRRPGLAIAFAICLLSLIGLPPLAGFIGKLGVLRALAEHNQMRWMIGVVALELGICAWVVLRVIALMLYGDPTGAPDRREPTNAWPLRVAGVAAVLVVALGLGGQRMIVFVRLPAAGSSFEAGDPDRLEWLERRRATWAAEDAAPIEMGEMGEDEMGDEAETEADTESEAAESEAAPEQGAERRSVEPCSLTRPSAKVLPVDGTDKQRARLPIISPTGNTSAARVLDDWYIVCDAHELKPGGKPLATSLYGVPIVVFRTASGKIGALLDRCPHRNVPLSDGAVDGERLRCGYHGWAFDTAGVCRDIPTLLAEPEGKARVARNFAAREQDGFVWVYATPDVEPVREPTCFAGFAIAPTTRAARPSTSTARSTLSPRTRSTSRTPAFLHGGLFRKPNVGNRIEVVVRRWHDRPRPSTSASPDLPVWSAVCWPRGEASSSTSIASCSRASPRSSTASARPATSARSPR